MQLGFNEADMFKTSSILIYQITRGDIYTHRKGSTLRSIKMVNETGMNKSSGYRGKGYFNEEVWEPLQKGKVQYNSPHHTN